MKTLKITGTSCLMQLCFAFLLLANPVLAQVPDLTNGESRSDELFWNLGSTGMRGWFYHEGTSTDLARQIEVEVVSAV